MEVGESIVSALTIQDGEPSLMRRLVWSWTLHVARCRTRGVWPTCVLERERGGVQWVCHSIIAKAKKNSLWPQNNGKKEKKNQRPAIQREFEPVGPSLLKTKQRTCETNSESGGIHGIVQMNSMFPDPWILGEVQCQPKGWCSYSLLHSKACRLSCTIYGI